MSKTNTDMKTENRRMRIWWTGVVLLWLACAPLAQAFYNPSTGRWLSRDPIGQLGGENSSVFAHNNPVTRADRLGLSDLEYSSEGVIYTDPWWPGRVEQYGGASGKQSSPDAWFWQTATQIHCPNGLCNSGGDGKSSSFIKAEVLNKSKCVLKLECSCTVRWQGLTFAPIRHGIFTVSGSVLGENFNEDYYAVDASDGRTSGWWIASGAGSKSHTKEFSLAPGASMELYNAYDFASSPAFVEGAGFRESMNGTCACTIK